MHRFDLQDWQWELIADLFPSNDGKEGGLWRDHRTILNGMFGVILKRLRTRLDKLEIHYTPKDSSWLNMAEIKLSAFEQDLPEHVGDRPAMQAHVSA